MILLRLREVGTESAQALAALLQVSSATNRRDLERALVRICGSCRVRGSPVIQWISGG